MDIRPSGSEMEKSTLTRRQSECVSVMSRSAELSAHHKKVRRYNNLLYFCLCAKMVLYLLRIMQTKFKFFEQSISQCQLVIGRVFLLL